MNYTKFFMDAELYSSSIKIEVKYNHRKLMKDIGQAHTVADLGGHWDDRPHSINSFMRNKFMLLFQKKNRFTEADLCVKQRPYLVILCVSKLGNNKQMIRDSVKSHRILFFCSKFSQESP
jgi:hypothetical protein